MPLFSSEEACRLAVHSGLRCTVRSVVSPVSARKLIGWVTRKLSSEITPANASRRPASVTSVVRSFLRSVQSLAYAITAATMISAASGARLMREATAMPKKTPNKPYQVQSPPGMRLLPLATFTAQHMLAMVNSTAKLSTVMKCDCWICITASALSAAANRPTRRLNSSQPMRKISSTLKVSNSADRCRPIRRSSR